MKENTETEKRKVKKKRKKKQISRVSAGRLRFVCDRPEEVH